MVKIYCSKKTVLNELPLKLNTITVENGYIATSSTTINGYSFFQGVTYYPSSVNRPLPVFTLKPPISKTIKITAFTNWIEAKGAGVYLYEVYKNDTFIQTLNFPQALYDQTIILDEPLILKDDILRIDCKAYWQSVNKAWTSFNLKMNAMEYILTEDVKAMGVRLFNDKYYLMGEN